MSHQQHEHPTQSIAPGAEPEQAGENPPAQWVNPAAAAAAEFVPPAGNVYHWPDDTIVGQAGPE
ncbi:MAG: hypothetical protein ABJD68_19340 [Nakamurella sp.]